MRGFARRPAAGLLLICLAAPACGYGLVGTTSVLPDHIEKIQVSSFENRTSRPEIEQRLTEQVAAQLSRRKRYDVVTRREDADAVLEGAVTNYSTVPVRFNSATGRANRVEVVVVIQASMRDVESDEILWSQTNLSFREQFDVEEEIAVEEFDAPESARLEFFDEETIAMDRIAAGAASLVIASIFEGF